MTRAELKLHCEKQVEACEEWASYKGEEPHGKIYEEHKLILELLEQTSPCDLCMYDPPSSGDGKPCTMCPASPKEVEE